MLLKRFFSATSINFSELVHCKCTPVALTFKSPGEKERTLKDVEKTPSVIIVGAGIAGLSAAARLVNAGISKVLVLEATERLGGRIYSCSMGSTLAEVGAEWISNPFISNPIVSLASQENILGAPSHNHDHSSGIYMTSDGRLISKSIGDKAYKTFKQIEDQAYAMYDLNKVQGGQYSLLNYFSVKINEETNNFPEHERDDINRVMYGLTNKISNRWGADLHQMSANLFGCFTPPTGKSIGVQSGFISILSPLLKVIPCDNIMCSKIVDTIQWDNPENPDYRVLVTTCDKSEYCADYIVVTTSLGVLKSEAERMFQPQLPQQKLDAIKGLGFGNICKIFIEYRQPFWVSKQGPIKFAWSMKELGEKDSWIKGLSSFQESKNSNTVLLATVAGKSAEIAENLSDQDVVETITCTLRQLTQDPTVPYPDSLLRSKWRTSPFFQGSNCYMSLDSTIGHQKDLLAPVPEPNKDLCKSTTPVIFFAGEATSAKFFSTVQGARSSGVKAAQDIIDLTEKFKGPPPKNNEE